MNRRERATFHFQSCADVIYWRLHVIVMECICFNDIRWTLTSGPFKLRPHSGPLNRMTHPVEPVGLQSRSIRVEKSNTCPDLQKQTICRWCAKLSVTCLFIQSPLFKCSSPQRYCYSMLQSFHFTCSKLRRGSLSFTLCLQSVPSPLFVTVESSQDQWSLNCYFRFSSTCPPFLRSTSSFFDNSPLTVFFSFSHCLQY